MKKHLGMSFALASLLLVACGDSSSGSDTNDNATVQEENKATLENGKVVYCDDEREGIVAALADGSFRRCENGLWVKISASEALNAEEIIGLDNVKSSSSVTQSSSSSATVIPDPESLSSATTEEGSSSSEASSSSSTQSSSSSIENSSSSSIKSSPSVTQSSSSLDLSSSSEQASQPVEESSSSVNKDPVEELYECADGSLVENLDDCEANSSSSSSSNVNSSSSSVIPDQESSSSVASSSSAPTPTSSSAPTGDLAVSHGKMIDLRDNQTYRTVTIGTQTWMAENLNYNYNEGSAKSYCYNDEASYCDKYGRLYLWSAAMDSAAVFSTAGKGCGYGVECSPSGLVRGVCPEGWHLPSNSEWKTLLDAVGDSRSGSNKHGFAVLLAGERSVYGTFGNTGYYAYFWSSSEDKNSWLFSYNTDYVGNRQDNKNDAHSVRCVKD